MLSALREIMGSDTVFRYLLNQFVIKKVRKAVDLLKLQTPFDPLKTTYHSIKTYR